MSNAFSQAHWNEDQDHLPRARGMSDDFRESLDKMAEELAAKKKAKLAQVAPSSASMSVGQPDQKEQQVQGVLATIQQFNDRLVKEWLHSLDDSDMQEVKRVFDEVNQLSAGDVQQVMSGRTPFEFIGSMMTQAQQDGGCGCDAGGAEVVSDIDAPAGNGEGMGPQLS